jgi:replicative DNA helicase
VSSNAIDLRSRRNQSAQQGADPSGRIPPHNLQAEESLLGAMLLSRDAIGPAVEACSSTDFYKPAHAHIFDAIISLWSRGEPADPVTVADELSRADLLEAIGGPAVLLSLQANTPATSNAARYARIVEEHALLRRLIRTAGDIAEMGYSLPDDVATVVDQAESLMFDVAQRRVADTTQPIRELLSQSLDRLEALYDRDQSITGVPTGFNDLDERLSGLQPNALIIVGARPAMGKALDLSTPIPTPTGWKTMGSLQVGDEVIDERGESCCVSYKSPVYTDHVCYEVTFDDGSKIVADAEHQWSVYDYRSWRQLREQGHAQPLIRTTQQLVDEGVKARTADLRPNWYVPLTMPLELPEQDLAVDPYVLGCWLGDGCSTSSEMTIGDRDLAHFQTQFELAGYPLVHRTALQYATCPVPGSGAWQGYIGDMRVLTRELRQVGLLGGSKKHIPNQYLRGSYKQRLSLLQGLMDTDGCVTNQNGTVELCLANRDLLMQARELVCSLGHKPPVIRYKPVALPDGRIAEAWRITWTPLDPVFRMSRKAEKLATTKSLRVNGKHTRRHIVSIELVPSVPVQCIQVDSPNHLYLAGESMIPTHNTSFALNMVSHAALSGTPVLFFSLEMSHLEITQRLLCAEARVDASRLRNGKLHDTDWPKINNAVGRLGEAPIFIDDNPMCTVMDIRAKARRLKATPSGLGLIVVDYLQLMSGRSNAESRQVEVSEMSRGLKILARELSVPVIALSQLSRSLEMRADKRPVLADLRESGSLEQDADVVMFLYRDEVYNPESPDKGTAEIIISKHRNGPVGTTTVAFIDRYTRFANMARV